LDVQLETLFNKCRKHLKETNKIALASSVRSNEDIKVAQFEIFKRSD
jgi:hypothetical protein